MTEDARKVFDKRYINDIEKAKIKPIHSYGMAARIKKSVENGIRGVAGSEDGRGERLSGKSHLYRRHEFVALRWGAYL